MPDTPIPDDARPLDRRAIRAVSFDLDETLWPIAPALERAERTLERWLAEHAPAVAARYDRTALKTLRERVWAQADAATRVDLGALRRRALALALEHCGDDPAKADAAYEAFHAARQPVELFADTDAALERIAARFPIAAVSNGTAEVARTRIGHRFAFQVSAGGVGASKPDARIFHAACRRFGLPPAAVLHVGDDLRLDVLGARAAGLAAVWVDRSGSESSAGAEPAPGPSFPDLSAVADWLLDDAAR